MRPSWCKNRPHDQRARGMPGARSARSLVCVDSKCTRGSHHGHAGSSGIPRAMVLTVSFVLSPVIGLSCHRRQRKFISANLTPASRRQDHTTSPSAPARFVKRAARVHRIPSRIDDVRNAPLSGRDGGACTSDLGQAGTEIFLQMGLDTVLAQRARRANQLTRKCEDQERGALLFPLPLWERVASRSEDG
jgi:hypothetical protein